MFLLQRLGAARDLIGQTGQLRVVILPVVDGLDLLGGVEDGLHLLLHQHKALHEAGFVLQVGHDGLGPDDHVPDALAGDAVILRDLGQGQILVIVQVEEFLLPRGQDLAVKIEQHRHAIGLVLHDGPSYVKL